MRTSLLAILGLNLLAFPASSPAADSALFDEVSGAAQDIDVITTLRVPSRQVLASNPPPSPPRGLWSRITERVQSVRGLPADGPAQIETVRTRHPELARLSTQIIAHSAELKTAAEGRTLPADYSASIKTHVQALNLVKADLNLPTEEKLRLSRAAEEDLKAKVAFARNNSSDPFQAIPVTVRTRLGDQEVTGCEVWCVAAAYRQDDTTRAERFNEFSSPTTKSLPAGIYRIWAVQGGRSGEARKVKVGVDPSSQAVDLLAPAP